MHAPEGKSQQFTIIRGEDFHQRMTRAKRKLKKPMSLIIREAVDARLKPLGL